MAQHGGNTVSSEVTGIPGVRELMEKLKMGEIDGFVLDSLLFITFQLYYDHNPAYKKEVGS